MNISELADESFLLQVGKRFEGSTNVKIKAILRDYS